MNCRFCASPLTKTVLDLNEQPSANRLLTKKNLEQIKNGAREHVSPLAVMFCQDCTLVQLSDTQPPDELFTEEYLYYSSFSNSWVAHARHYVDHVIQRFGFDGNSRVFEIGSNDGYLLQHFVAQGIPCLGIDPAAKAAEAAANKGIETFVGFFGNATTGQILARAGQADLILGNNVFAHVPSINDFVVCLKKCLKPDGVITFEFPHLARLIQSVQFDTIYDEHYFYFSLSALERLFAHHGFRLFDIHQLPTHGGSLRIFVTHTDASHKTEKQNIDTVRELEMELRLHEFPGYSGFRNAAEAIRKNTLKYIRQAKENGLRIAAYGAAAKGTVFLNYCGIGADQIDFVVDDTPAKQGRYLPGVHIPVVAAGKIEQEKPDIIIILPWNLRDEISAKLAPMKKWGGRCVSFVPALLETTAGE